VAPQAQGGLRDLAEALKAVPAPARSEQGSKKRYEPSARTDTAPSDEQALKPLGDRVPLTGADVGGGASRDRRVGMTELFAHRLQRRSGLKTGRVGVPGRVEVPRAPLRVYPRDPGCLGYVSYDRSSLEASARPRLSVS
jgi:hypothetical protein